MHGISDCVFDAALLLPNSFQSALTVFRARIPERWGYGSDWRGPLLTRTVARPIGVKPAIVAPSKEKCSFQFWVRGLNRDTS